MSIDKILKIHTLLSLSITK